MSIRHKRIIRSVIYILIFISLVCSIYFFYQYYLSKKRAEYLQKNIISNYSLNKNNSVRNKENSSSRNHMDNLNNANYSEQGFIKPISNYITEKLDHLQYNTGNIDVWTVNENVPTYKEISSKYINAKKINNDVVGWIWIQNTNIDYPIEHTSTDTYYLHHNWRNNAWWNGAIFLDKSIPSLNENTLLINGHNMLNSLMFAQLMKFRNENFFNQHNKIVIFNGSNKTEEVFNPIGCFYANPNQRFEFNIPKDQRLKYYKYMESKSFYPIESVNSNKFLFLNSCLSDGTNHHLIVMSQEIQSIRS